MWGCEFPLANDDWYVYLQPYGFNWWLIGEVEVEGTESSAEVPQELSQAAPVSSRT